MDGILLHMLLRWHHMLSHRIPPDTMAGLHTNMTGDGLFHAFTWIVTFIGLLMFWKAARLSASGEQGSLQIPDRGFDARHRSSRPDRTHDLSSARRNV